MANQLTFKEISVGETHGLWTLQAYDKRESDGLADLSSATIRLVDEKTRRVVVAAGSMTIVSKGKCVYQRTSSDVSQGGRYLATVTAIHSSGTVSISDPILAVINEVP